MIRTAIRACLFAVALALAGGGAMAETAAKQNCATFEKLASDLALRYVQTLTELVDAQDALDRAKAELDVYSKDLDQVILRWGDFPGIHPLTQWTSIFALSPGYEQASQAVQQASTRVDRLLNNLAAQQVGLAAIIEVLDVMCGGTGTTTASDGSGGAGDGGDGGATFGMASLSGYWGSNTGKHYRAAGGTFHRHGKPALSFSCAGSATTKYGIEGQACEGQWFNSDGSVGGAFRAVLYRTESGRLFLEGQSNYVGYEDQWYAWDFSKWTREEAQEGGLTTSEETK